MADNKLKDLQISLETLAFSEAVSNKRAQFFSQIKSGQEFNNSYGQDAILEIIPIVEDYIKGLYSKRNQHTKKFYWEIIKTAHEAHLEDKKLMKPEVKIAEMVAVLLVSTLSKQIGLTPYSAKMAKTGLRLLNVPFDLHEDYMDSAINFFGEIIKHVSEMTDIFTVDQVNGREYFLFLSPQWEELVNNVKDTAGTNASAFKPMVVPPVPHTDLVSGKGGYLISDSPLLKHPAKMNGKIAKSIKNFKDKMFFESINKIQGTPYCVNTKLLEVLRSYYENGYFFNEFPIEVDEEKALIEAQKSITKRNKKREKYAKDTGTEYTELLKTTVDQEIRKYRNTEIESVRKTLHLFEQADFYAGFKEIFYPIFLDARGRMYAYASDGLTNVGNGNEMSKALLQFANKQEIDENGIFNLYLSLGNALGHDKKHVNIKCDLAIDWYREHEVDFQNGNFDIFFTNQSNFDEPINALAIVLELLEFYKDPTYKTGYIAHRDARVSGSSIIGTVLRDRYIMELTSVIDTELEKLPDAYTMVSVRALELAEASTNPLAQDLLEIADKLFYTQCIQVCGDDHV